MDTKELCNAGKSLSVVTALFQQGIQEMDGPEAEDAGATYLAEQVCASVHVRSNGPAFAW